MMMLKNIKNLQWQVFVLMYFSYCNFMRQSVIDHLIRSSTHTAKACARRSLFESQSLPSPHTIECLPLNPQGFKQHPSSFLIKSTKPCVSFAVFTRCLYVWHFKY